jgi:putative transcriptional regulator
MNGGFFSRIIILEQTLPAIGDCASNALFFTPSVVIMKRNERVRMAVLSRSLQDFLKIDLDEGAVNRLPWRDFGNGLLMARLAREGRRELVLYRVRADAKPDAFLKHEHIGGEIYLVLKGRIADETGEYQEGDFVFLDAKSVHTPRATGDTLVLVVWPAGVRIIEDNVAQPRRS